MMTDYEVVESMKSHGGSFARALADAFTKADPENYQKLKDAFPDLWEDYVEIAECIKRRREETK